MYFKSRVQAGNLLADQLEAKYRYENCAVVSLSDGGVMVGAEIAMRLHCALMLLVTAAIDLPRENMTIAAVNPSGGVTYNSQYSTGELDEMESEYRVVIEEAKIAKVHELNRLLGDGGLIREDLLRGHTVILVSDGLKDAFVLDAAADFLKPIKLEKLLVATPIASVPALDRMHVIADEIHCLDVLPNYMTTDHYYEAHDNPNHQEVIRMIQSIVLQWR